MTPQDLSDTLRERTRVLSEGAMDGTFVLYWVRGAMRSRENPALDAAIEAANRLGLPLFVHQALSERYPWANDRHHTFILEGARDLARGLAARGIGYAFHLERPGHRGAITKALGERAALVIAEDLPTHPMVDWVQHLARDISTPVWLVDAACIVPMNLVGRAYDRAFAFRKATRDAFEARHRLPWTEADLDSPAFVPEDLPYAPVDLEGDLGALVAACAIDHTIGPVSDTRGGEVAGYARWQAFVESGGLRRYASSRNNPAKDGVSRMSAYLHHGMVAPTRLARESAEIGGKGPDKYLDELWVWREIAWSFCRFKPHHDSLRALPDWALRTLHAHADDPRPTLFSREQLGRARTGDPLWDACQQSLLVHGELHNNVRMTWGKALLGWTRGPRHALDTLIDLNHRYALDGRDPASFGGLLWCMGQFDRPFKPEQPVIGTVRPRRTDAHAERMDLDTYRSRVARPLHAHRPRIGVIGAGLAGALCARTLADHGLEVVAFDKGRGPGGRLSTRRAEARRFDHGAIALFEPPPQLQRYVDAWLEQGVLARWEAPRIRVEGEQTTRMPGDLLVGTPGMNALVKHLLADVDCRFSSRVTAIERLGSRLRLQLEDGSASDVDHVIVAVPAPQAVPLLQPLAPALSQAMERVVYVPSWVAMVGLPTPTGKRWGWAELADDPVVSRIVRNQTKPGRPPGEQWVLHATDAWTEAHLEAERSEIAKRLWSHVQTRLDLADADHLTAHRWRYASIAEPVGEPWLLSEDARIGVCGDALLGDGIFGALSSGAAMAGRLLGHLHKA